MKRGRMKRWISAILTVAIMMTTLLPNLSFGVSAEEIKQSNVNNATTEEAEKPEETVADLEAFVVREIIEERTADTKHFLMSDGTKVAAIYGENVHYLEENTWKEIDNDIIYNEKGKYYENAANNYAARFSADNTANKQVSVTYSGYTIDFKYIEQPTDNNITNDATATVVDKKIAPTVVRRATATDKNGGNAKMQAISSRSGKITYNTNSSKISLEYLPVATGIKENIVVSGPIISGSFAFDITAENMTLSLQEDGSIKAISNDTQKAVFTIPAPYMFDNLGQYSYDVRYVLTQVDGIWRVTVTADTEWINAEGRAYPVKIDPAILTEQNRSSVRTAFVSSYDSDYCFNDNRLLEVGCYYHTQGVTTKSQALIDIELPELSPSQTIISAKLNLYGKAEPYSTATQNTIINIHKLTEAFTCETSGTGTNWEDEIQFTPTPEDYNVVSGQLYNEQRHWYTFDVTKTVQGWHSGETQYGFLIKVENESVTKNNFLKMTYSSEDKTTADDDEYPVLVLNYRDTKGVENYWTYTTAVGGNGGALGVNNYSGNVVASVPLAGIGGTRMPATITLNYNSANKNSFANGTKVAYGWQINYDWKILQNGSELADLGYKYRIIDGDGTEHHFYNEDIGSSVTTWEDEDGLGLTLTKLSSTTDGVLYTIEDKSKGLMEFDADGYLINIYDTNSSTKSSKNKLTITRNGGRISKITDGAGKEYSFSYASYGGENYLTSITDPYGDKVSISTSTASGNLTQLKYESDVDGTKTVTETTAITYSAKGIASISNNDGTTTAVTYTNNDKAQALSIKDRESELIDSYSFAYSYCQTDITDRYDIKVSYQFDTFGHTTGIVDQESGMAQYYSYNRGGEAASGGLNKSANKLTGSSNVQQALVNYAKNPGFDNGTASYTYVGGVSTNASEGRTGSDCIKVSRTTPASNDYVSSWAGVSQNITLSAGTYTFSAYVNTKGTTLSGTGVRALTAINGTLNDISAPIIKTTNDTDEDGTNNWQRISATIELTAETTITVFVGFADGSTTGTVYIDDLQIEKGTFANSYNLINGWQSSDASGSGTINNGQVTVTQDSEYKACYYTNFAEVSGKAGDIFSFGCWSCDATSVKINGVDRNYSSSTCTPNFKAELVFFDSNGNETEKTEVKFNDCISSAQFVAAQAIATKSYAKVALKVSYDYNVGAAKFYSPFIYKENFGESYTYDSDGNVVSSVDNAEKESTFAYNENKLSSLSTPTGSSFMYAYTNGTSLISTAVSSSGQKYEFDYDEYGNATGLEIVSKNYETTLNTGTTYYFRNKYSANAMGVNSSSDTVAENFKYYEDYYKTWKLEAVDAANGIYRIQKLTYDSNTAYLYVHKNGDNYELKLQYGTSGLDEGNSYFKFVQNEDGTYTIKTKRETSDYTYCIDGQPGDRTETSSRTPIYAVTSEEKNLGQRWYLYAEGSEGTQKIQSSVTYTDNGSKLATSTDALGNTVTYAYNNEGLQSRITDAKGIFTQYYYDDQKRLRLVSSGGSSVTYAYTEYDEIDKITRGSSYYDFDYTVTGQIQKICINATTLAQYTYNNKNLLSQMTYGTSSNNVKYTYDSLDRISKIVYNDNGTESAEYTYEYDNVGRTSSVTDGRNKTKTNYAYDMSGRLSEVTETSGTGTSKANTSRILYSYDAKNRLVKYALSLTGIGSGVKEKIMKAVYGDATLGENPDAVYEWHIDGNKVLEYEYDNLGRAENKTLTTSAGENVTASYTYKAGDGTNTTTTQLARQINGIYGDYQYVYDANGNIVRVWDYSTGTGKQIQYEYDSLNQLIRENNKVEDKTYTWTYDAYGNIQSKKTYVFTTGALGEVVSEDTYTYGNSAWADQLTAYNGQSITYDSIGNPLSYRGMTMTWTQGRRLESIEKSGSTFVYTYNANGIRTSKSVYGETYEMLLNGDVLLGVREENIGTLLFLRDDADRIIGFEQYSVSGSLLGTYYYEFNAQGDVVALYDENKAIIAKYSYNSWGKLLSVTNVNGNAITASGHVANLNPIRYRGYYYDVETGFYYLNSRYYDPNTCRFINADEYASTGQGIIGFNMYAYCLNNPVVFSDSYGNNCEYSMTNPPPTNWTGDLTNQDYAIMDIYIATVDGKYDDSDYVEEILAKHGIKDNDKINETIDKYYEHFSLPIPNYGKETVLTVSVQILEMPITIDFGVVVFNQGSHSELYFQVGFTASIELIDLFDEGPISTSISSGIVSRAYNESAIGGFMVDAGISGLNTNILNASADIRRKSICSSTSIGAYFTASYYFRVY